MAQRFTQPDPAPAIQRTIIRARRKPGPDKAMGLVVAGSLAATLLGWGIFAHEDAETAAAQAATAPAAIQTTETAPVVAPATPPPTAVSVAVVPTVRAAVPTATAAQSSATTQSSTTAGTTAGTGRTAFTTTRSSR